MPSVFRFHSQSHYWFVRQGGLPPPPKPLPGSVRTARTYMVYPRCGTGPECGAVVNPLVAVDVKGLGELGGMGPSNYSY